MRILMMTRRLVAGGAERQLVVLARALRERGHDVEVALFYEGGELAHELDGSGIAVHYLRKKTRLGFAGAIRNLVTLVKTRRIEAVYSLLPGENIATAVLKLLRRRVRVIWGVHSAVRDLASAGLFARIVYRVEPWLSSIPDAIVAVSEVAKHAAVARGLSARRMQVVPNAIDTSAFAPQPAAAAAVRAELGAGEGPLIGIVGRIVPIKNHQLFLEAAALFRERHGAARFLIAGGGPREYVAKLEVLADRLRLRDAVLWTGVRRDLAAVYSAIDVLTLCSRSESFGNVIGEAMACGTLCVATNVGAAAELIDGSFGTIVDDSPAAIARGWESVLARSTPELRAAARQSIVERFAAPVVAQRLEALFTA